LKILQTYFQTSLNAGSGATFASDSNFFGQNAGYGATGASNSNFFGKMLVMGQQVLNSQISWADKLVISNNHNSNF
jgi:hypothetical protein